MNILKVYRKQCKIFLAQTALHLEGIHLDDVQTQDLLDRQTHRCFEVDEDDAIVMRNIVDTLDYLEKLDISNLSIDTKLYIKLNELLAKEQALFVGRFRNRPTAIGCIPDDIPVYDESLIKNEVERLSNINEANYHSVVPECFCNLSLMQPFFDGNKRSTAFLCNVALIKKNLGVFSISYEKLGEFNSLLRDYYTGENKNILDFIGKELIITTKQLNDENCNKNNAETNAFLGNDNGQHFS